MAIVYKHIRRDSGEVFYIGIGINESRAYSAKNRNSHWKNYTNKHQYLIEISHKDLIWEEACSIEKYLISFYGRKDMNKGSLLNMTDGGEGLCNASIETLQKFKSNRLGKNLKESTKARLSEVMKTKKPINRLKVYQYDLDNCLLNEYESIKDAETHTRIAKSSISKCCKGSLKTAGKFIWKYAE